MIIKTAKYEQSAVSVDKCPMSDKMEFAFIGRSNVGKSSLINMLAGHEKLAITSSTPGKTALISHFLINDEWYLVDLPGYGYAKRSKADQERFFKMINSYVLHRERMANLFVLIDGNIPPQEIDLDFIRFLGEEGVPFCLVFTKADKSRRGSFPKSVKRFLARLSEEWEELPPYFTASSTKRLGRQQILDYIDYILHNTPTQSDIATPQSRPHAPQSDTFTPQNGPLASQSDTVRAENSTVGA